MSDEEKATEKPIRDVRMQGGASRASGVPWWPASRLLLDIIKQG